MNVKVSAFQCVAFALNINIEIVLVHVVILNIRAKAINQNNFYTNRFGAIVRFLWQRLSFLQYTLSMRTKRLHKLNLKFALQSEAMNRRKQ